MLAQEDVTHQGPADIWGSHATYLSEHRCKRQTYTSDFCWENLGCVNVDPRETDGNQSSANHWQCRVDIFEFLEELESKEPTVKQMYVVTF